MIAIALHLIGDCFLQLALRKLLPKKEKAFLGLLCHCLYADSLAFAFLGYRTAGFRGLLLGVALAPLAHLAVDSLALRGSIKIKLLDQALHLVALFAFGFLGR